jgi:hypothetical protein
MPGSESHGTGLGLSIAQSGTGPTRRSPRPGRRLFSLDEALDQARAVKPPVDTGAVATTSAVQDVRAAIARDQ